MFGIISFVTSYQTNGKPKEKGFDRGRGKITVLQRVKHFIKIFEEEGRAVDDSTDVIPMFFDGANSAVEIIAEQETKDYHSYSYQENGINKDVANVKAFKKITYKNIYPNIDIEYTFLDL